ncbi:MAG: hypothetical protein KME27_11005 [Lyngbya sp. HA4199-MV5]|nr:hypothetical protein [Lyngbya sp. HA4199-MV5]
MTEPVIPDPPKSRRKKAAPTIKPPHAQCPDCKCPDRYHSVTQIDIEDWRCQHCHRFLAWIKHPIFNL